MLSKIQSALTNPMPVALNRNFAIAFTLIFAYYGYMFWQGKDQTKAAVYLLVAAYMTSLIMA